LIKQLGKFAYSPQLFYLADDGNNDMNAYYDMTSGNDLFYPATPGWDFATGLGTPNIANFYTAISGKIKEASQAPQFCYTLLTLAKSQR